MEEKKQVCMELVVGSLTIIIKKMVTGKRYVMKPLEWHMLI